MPFIYVAFDFTFSNAWVSTSSPVRTIHDQGRSVHHTQLKHAKIKVATSDFVFIEFYESQFVSMVRYLYEAEGRKANRY
jgi:hypothetical protein